MTLSLTEETIFQVTLNLRDSQRPEREEAEGNKGRESCLDVAGRRESGRHGADRSQRVGKVKSVTPEKT